MAKEKQQPQKISPDTFDIGLDFPDFDEQDFDFSDFGDMDETGEDTDYMKPKARCLKASQVYYGNAVKLAQELRLEKGERSDVIVGGDFIFGDFIEAYLTTHNVKCLEMRISTLSLSQENVDSLYNLMKAGYIDRLTLLVSVYFWGNERNGLIPYIYKKLDNVPNTDFQLAVAAIHTKTAQFATLGGRKMVIHGSANLRSSGNIEQFTIEENTELYDFYAAYLDKVAERYSTIRKPVKGKALDILEELNENGN